MTSIITLLVGIALIIGTIISVISSLSRTPDNLRGFYGLFYSIISLSGFIGGIALVALYFIS
ncbi:MAG: hypothetical protein E7653_06735 [Ruminococcaceae bacterium]|nr:hypothetical protein [Oscillospiraceae bacterium]